MRGETRLGQISIPSAPGDVPSLGGEQAPGWLQGPAQQSTCHVEACPQKRAKVTSI